MTCEADPITAVRWEPWRPFPNPEKGEYLIAPFGAGVYWLRDIDTEENVYIGEGGHVAQRMTSLLPAPLGHGTRNNDALRAFVLDNIERLEYTTTACATKANAVALQHRLHQQHGRRFSS